MSTNRTYNPYQLEHLIWVYVKTHPGSSIVDVEAGLQLRKSTAAAALRRMAERGLMKSLKFRTDSDKFLRTRYEVTSRSYSRGLHAPHAPVAQLPLFAAPTTTAPTPAKISAADELKAKFAPPPPPPIVTDPLDSIRHLNLNELCTVRDFLVKLLP